MIKSNKGSVGAFAEPCVCVFSICVQSKVVGGRVNGDDLQSPNESNPVQDNAPF